MPLSVLAGDVRMIFATLIWPIAMPVMGVIVFMDKYTPLVSQWIETREMLIVERQLDAKERRLRAENRLLEAEQEAARLAKRQDAFAQLDAIQNKKR